MKLLVTATPRARDCTWAEAAARSTGSIVLAKMIHRMHKRESLELLYRLRPQAKPFSDKDRLDHPNMWERECPQDRTLKIMQKLITAVQAPKDTGQ